MSDSRKGKKKLWLIPLGAAVLAVAAAGVLILRTLQPEDTGTAADMDTADRTRGAVLWNGKEYEYNDHLSNYLVLGIDTRENTETSVGQADAGQADAIYLVSRDRVKNTVTVISVPRDTMTEIETFTPGGESLGKSTDHISLSYAYGDGGHESCRLAREAVSNLFYGLPIQGYCAVNMDGISALVQSVGTVTVTVPNDSLEAEYPEFTAGSQVTLNEENTEIFVRYRDTDERQSALARMERQEEFIRALGAAVKALAAQDSGFAGKLYETMGPYMVTSMGNDEFVRLMQSAAEGGASEGWTVPGQPVDGQYYDEYHVDDEALYEKIIETFYTEIGTTKSSTTENGTIRGETP